MSKENEKKKEEYCSTNDGAFVEMMLEWERQALEQLKAEGVEVPDEFLDESK